MKILCVEDDEGLAKLLQLTLSKQHYQVEIATNGQAGWALAETIAYDLILLDWLLPKLTGIEFCRRLRNEKSSAFNPNRDTPVLLMTALDAVTSKVMGLDAGADDYVVKPLNLDELLARIRALLRRKQGERSPLLTWGELCLNPNICEVTYRNQSIQLATKEYELLELFLRNPDQLFSLSRLLDRLWPAGETPSEGTVRAHMKGLRQKLKQAGVDDPFETVYKLGYRLRTNKQAEETEKKEDEKEEDEKKKDRVDEGTASVANSPTLAQVRAGLWQVWQECCQSYYERLATIQKAIPALQNGTLTAEQKHIAEREAHTLIGSLGSFGLDEASHIARQIQQILKQPEPLEDFKIDQLTQLTTALQQKLENLTEEKPESIKPTESTPEDSKTGTQEISLTNPGFPLPLAPTLLIVDDDLPLAKLIAQEAESWGFQAEIVTHLAQAQQALNDSLVDAILLDLNFSGSSQSGLDFLATVHGQHPDIPVVMLTAEETFEKRVEAARLGSRCFLQKPITPPQVLAAVTQVLQQANQSTARILIVDDDLALLQLLKNLLEPCGYQLTLLSDPRQFWQTLERMVPDLLILDIELCEPEQSRQTSETPPTLSGIELCQVIRSDLRWNRLPVIFLSAHTDVETVQRGFAAGADDFLNKPVVAQELLTRVHTRLEQRKLWGTTDLDELTGVSLRRKALQDLARLIRLAQRQQQPFSLAVLDLDHFKRVNDQYGHHAGDHVLNYLGKLLRQSFRQEDIIGRWGGEEFIIGMYGITKQDGIKRLENVLSQLNHYVFLAPDGASFQVTFSAGIAQLLDDGNELQTLYRCADNALYQAKSKGRNQIVAAKRSAETGNISVISS